MSERPTKDERKRAMAAGLRGSRDKFDELAVLAVHDSLTDYNRHYEEWELDEARTFAHEALSASRDTEEDRKIASAARWVQKLMNERAMMCASWDRLERRAIVAEQQLEEALAQPVPDSEERE